MCCCLRFDLWQTLRSNGILRNENFMQIGSKLCDFCRLFEQLQPPPPPFLYTMGSNIFSKFKVDFFDISRLWPTELPWISWFSTFFLQFFVTNFVGNFFDNFILQKIILNGHLEVFRNSKKIFSSSLQKHCSGMFPELAWVFFNPS